MGDRKRKKGRERERGAGEDKKGRNKEYIF